jgi:DNA adenine methylase
MEYQRQFTADEIQSSIEGEDLSRRTVRNTLNAMEDMGFLESGGGRGSAPREYYPPDVAQPIEPGGYTPRDVSSSSTIPYPGAQNRLSERIIDMMPAHDTYVEVFGGSAGVLYNKPRSKYEVYNDIDDDLTQFFRVLRNRPEELAEWLQAVPYSRRQYEEWVDEFYDGIRPDDDIARAGRFFSLRYMQYIGLASTANGFKTRARRSPARTFDNARRRLNELADRFAQVTIENQDYSAILETYDDSSVDVLFYADPPYPGSEDQYDMEFDHDAFINCLLDIESEWIVSYADVPDQLRSYTSIECESRHRMQRHSGDVAETLICNFDPEERMSFRSDEGKSGV